MMITPNYFNYSASLFSSGNQRSPGGDSNMLGQYMSIKNGSYKKALSSYLKKMDGKESDTSNSSSSSAATSEKSKILETKKDADALKESAEKLLKTGKNSIWEKVEKEVKDEKTGQMVKVKDYDYDRISKALTEFASSYNSVLESSGKQNDLSVLKKTAFMTGTAKSNKISLSKLGITVGSNNKISVDETKLKSANMDNLKSFFTGSGSFADRIQSKASDISKAAVNAVNALKTYNKGGYLNGSGNTG